MYIKIYINTVLVHRQVFTVFRTLSALAKIPFLANSFQSHPPFSSSSSSSQCQLSDTYFTYFDRLSTTDLP